MTKTTAVAVCSRSFSKNPVLRAELLIRYPQARFNDTGRVLEGGDLVGFLKGAEKVIVATEKITGPILKELNSLRVISKYGVGIDNVDLVTAKSLDIKVGWKPGVNRRSVSELVIGLAITLSRQCFPANRLVQSGDWTQKIGPQISEKIFGIVGFGNIGRDLAQLLKPFDAKILVNDILDLTSEVAKAGAKQVPLEELLAQSDYVTLHVPLTDKTKKMIGAGQLTKMKKTAYLINTSRGGVVDETALLASLKEGQLAGAALDVLEVEPPKNLELIQHPSVVVTPHIGGSAQEAILMMGRAAIDGLDTFYEF